MPDHFGLSDGVRTETPPDLYAAWHVDGWTWAKPGLSYRDTSRAGARDWNQVIAQFRAVLAEAGVTLDHAADNPHNLREILVDFISAKANALLATGATPYLDEIATAAVNDPQLVQALIAAIDGETATPAEKVSLAGDIATGNINVPSVNGGAHSGLRNRLINPAFAVDQEGVAAAGVTTHNTTVCDGYRLFTNGHSGAAILRRVAGERTRHALELEVTAADAAPGATAQVAIGAEIEGHQVADLRAGTAQARTVTVSFRIWSSLAGPHCFTLFNDGVNMCRIIEFDVDAAEAWRDIALTFPMATAGTWLTDAGNGLRCRWYGYAGSTWHGAPDTWHASTKLYTDTAVNLLATAGNKLRIEQPQIEVGDRASPFERRPEPFERSLCQRYWRKLPAVKAEGYQEAAGVIRRPVFFGGSMRAAPTVSFANAADTNLASAAAENVGVDSLALRLTATATGSVATTRDIILDARF